MAAKKSVRRSKTVRSSRSKKPVARSSRSKKPARGSKNPFQEMIDNKVLSFNIKTMDKEKKKLEANRVKIFSSLPENPNKNTEQVACMGNPRNNR